jgi:hypothetical protein
MTAKLTRADLHALTVQQLTVIHRKALKGKDIKHFPYASSVGNDAKALARFYALHDFVKTRSRAEREQFLGEDASVADIRLLAKGFKLGAGKNVFELRNALDKSYRSGVARAFSTVLLVLYSPAILIAILVQTGFMILLANRHFRKELLRTKREFFLNKARQENDGTTTFRLSEN